MTRPHLLGGAPDLKNTDHQWRLAAIAGGCTARRTRMKSKAQNAPSSQNGEHDDAHGMTLPKAG
jgi:hypothetical protein